jgi:magnesium-transporting ATPase (P-type)
MGTSIATGTGRAVVVATAMKTELGGIAEMLEAAGGEERTPIEKRLDSFGRVLVWAALGIVAMLFGLGVVAWDPTVGTVHDFGESRRGRIIPRIKIPVTVRRDGLPADEGTTPSDVPSWMRI